MNTSQVVEYYTKLRDELPEHVENREALVAGYNQYIGYLKERGGFRV